MLEPNWQRTEDARVQKTPPKSLSGIRSLLCPRLVMKRTPGCWNSYSSIPSSTLPRIDGASTLLRYLLVRMCTARRGALAKREWHAAYSARGLQTHCSSFPGCGRSGGRARHLDTSISHSRQTHASYRDSRPVSESRLQRKS